MGSWSLTFLSLFLSFHVPFPSFFWSLYLFAILVCVWSCYCHTASLLHTIKGWLWNLLLQWNRVFNRLNLTLEYLKRFRYSNVWFSRLKTVPDCNICHNASPLRLYCDKNISRVLRISSLGEWIHGTHCSQLPVTSCNENNVTFSVIQSSIKNLQFSYSFGVQKYLGFVVP